MLTVKQLREELENYGDDLPVVLNTIDGQRESDSVEPIRVTITDDRGTILDSEFDGMAGVAINTSDPG